MAEELLKKECRNYDVFEFCRARIDLNGTISIRQEFDDYGNHRLVYGENESEWTSYQGISALDIPRVGMYRGTSEYYNGTLPRVFQLIEQLAVR